jgi:hypothetical protein
LDGERGFTYVMSTSADVSGSGEDVVLS